MPLFQRACILKLIAKNFKSWNWDKSNIAGGYILRLSYYDSWEAKKWFIFCHNSWGMMGFITTEGYMFIILLIFYRCIKVAGSLPSDELYMYQQIVCYKLTAF